LTWGRGLVYIVSSGPLRIPAYAQLYVAIFSSVLITGLRLTSNDAAVPNK